MAERRPDLQQHEFPCERRSDRPPAPEKDADLMTEKDDRLYVHTYSYDYVIEIF